MVTIKIYKLCGEYCIDDKDVKALSKQIIEQLTNNDRVLLDFSGVDTVLTAFFNGLLTELFNKFDEDKIKNLVGFIENTPDSIQTKYYRSLDNALKFFNSPKEKRDQIKERVNKIFTGENNLDEPHKASR